MRWLAGVQKFDKNSHCHKSTLFNYFLIIPTRHHTNHLHTPLEYNKPPSLETKQIFLRRRSVAAAAATALLAFLVLITPRNN